MCLCKQHQMYSIAFIDDNFAESQQKFMEKYYHHFEDVEENKLIYTDIHREYVRMCIHPLQ